MARQYKTLMERKGYKLIRQPRTRPNKIQIAFIKAAPVIQVIKQFFI